jgi:hypothetical protein
MGRTRRDDQTRDGGRYITGPLEEPAAADLDLVEVFVFGVAFFVTHPSDTYPPVPVGNLTKLNYILSYYGHNE